VEVREGVGIGASTLAGQLRGVWGCRPASGLSRSADGVGVEVREGVGIGASTLAG
jgi:hypothetical protein